MEKYKPILVIYYDIKEVDQILPLGDGLREKFGYPVLMMGSAGSELRAEIISVDKATVVEDIQKYIDTKIFEKKEDFHDVNEIQTC